MAGRVEHEHVLILVHYRRNAGQRLGETVRGGGSIRRVASLVIGKNERAAASIESVRSIVTASPPAHVRQGGVAIPPRPISRSMR